MGIDIIQGVSFQVPLSHRKVADFFLREQSIILEFHPTVLQHEFQSRNAYYLISRALVKINKHEREMIVDAMKDEMNARYCSSRRFFTKESKDEDVKNATVLVVENQTELYKKIIKPYCKNVPSLDIFVAEFQAILQNPDRYRKFLLESC